MVYSSGNWRQLSLVQFFPSVRFVLNHRFSNCGLRQTRSTWSTTCFGQFLCLSSRVFHCIHSNGLCHTGYSYSLRAGSGRNQFHPDPARKLSANRYDIYHCCVYSEKTPDDGQRNCLNNVEFYFKNKFEKLVPLVGYYKNRALQYFILN